jgi:nickel-dependent lactate racemase
VAPRRRSDIVVTSNGGAPLDQNIYQAVKGLCAAEAAAREGGVIVICAECADGTGGESFYRAMRDCADPADLLARVRAVPREETAADQWQYQILARILAKNRVLFVTDPRLERTIAEMKMEYAPTLGRALELARAYAGSDDIIVIPDGVSVVVDAGEPEGGG